MAGISKANRGILKAKGFADVSVPGCSETWVRATANGNVHVAKVCRPANRKLGWVELRTDILEDTPDGVRESSECEIVKDLETAI